MHLFSSVNEMELAVVDWIQMKGTKNVFFLGPMKENVGKVSHLQLYSEVGEVYLLVK